MSSNKECPTCNGKGRLGIKPDGGIAYCPDCETTGIASEKKCDYKCHDLPLTLEHICNCGHHEKINYPKMKVVDPTPQVETSPFEAVLDCDLSLLSEDAHVAHLWDDDSGKQVIERYKQSILAAHNSAVEKAFRAGQEDCREGGIVENHASFNSVVAKAVEEIYRDVMRLRVHQFDDAWAVEHDFIDTCEIAKFMQKQVAKYKEQQQ